MIQILLLDDSNDKRESLKSVILPLFPQGEILIEVNRRSFLSSRWARNASDKNVRHAHP